MLRRQSLKFIGRTPVAVIAMFPLLFAASSADAAITWRYNVSGQWPQGSSSANAISFSGTLTTYGDVLDLARADSFPLNSIDSFIVNGIDLSAGKYWVGSGISGLPFRNGEIGAIAWNGVFGAMDTDSLSAGAFGPPLQSLRITLAAPGSVSKAVGLNENAGQTLKWEYQIFQLEFNTTSTSIMPIPESSTFALALTAIYGIFTVFRTRVRRFI